MLDALLAADLALLTLAQMLLVWSCLRARREVPKWGEHVHAQATEWTGMLSEVGAVLTDIADALDEARTAAAGAPSPMAGASIGEMLTAGLMSRIMMASEHGATTQPVGPVHEGQHDDDPQATEEDDQPHGGR